MRPSFRLGEERIVAWLRQHTRSGRGGRTVGIGDDAAVIRGLDPALITVDLLVEGQHFEFGLMTPEDLAVRALEVNLSDIAAMGGRPRAVFLGLAWPAGDVYSARGERFLAAFVVACAARGVELLGGDTVRARKGSTTVAVTVAGTPTGRYPPVLRSGGKVGDVLAVTGPLGGSALGLRLARRRPARLDRHDRAALARFRRPRARTDAAPLIARHARAALDLSDGLALDAVRLAHASGCGFQIEARLIPQHPGLARRCAPDEALELALSGGEDFELLVAIAPERWARACREASRRGIELIPIGRLLDPNAGRVLRHPDGRTSPWRSRGWDPFAPAGVPRLDAAGEQRVGPGSGIATARGIRDIGRRKP